MKTLVNPIESEIQKALCDATHISIAVPFLSFSTVRNLITSNVCNILDKRIIVKLDELHSISYDLAAIKHLLEQGFKVRFDNTIHLKLYILGDRIFISSGNLTDGGLKNNFELTVETTEAESHVHSVFEDLWLRNVSNEVTLDYIKQNWEKHLFLKKKYPRSKSITPIIKEVILSSDEETLIDAVLFEEKNRDWHHHMIGLVNKRRSKFFKQLIDTGFKQEYFYAIEGNSNRKNCLFYQFVYGNEEKLAGTGLRETQFKDVFTSPQFEHIIFYIYPKFKKVNYSWDLTDKTEFLNFCKGLFEFNVKSFKEAMPIRLANYFYPEHFLPIFKISHLKEMCAILGYECTSKDRAIQLFEYTQFLNDRLKNVPFNNFIKSNILYKLLYTMKVKREIERNNQEPIEGFIVKQRKQWIRNTMFEGLELIRSLQKINNISIHNPL